MAGLSTKIKGLRFMQRAMDKAATDERDGEREKRGGEVEEVNERVGVPGGAWIAEAATSRCVVLRGEDPTPPSSRPKGRLSFGKTLVDVESEQIRIVTEQMQSPEVIHEGEGGRETAGERPPVVNKKDKRRGGAGNKTSTKKKKRRA